MKLKLDRLTAQVLGHANDGQWHGFESGIVNRAVLRLERLGLVEVERHGRETNRKGLWQFRKVSA